jgi:hypothetical protein
MATQGQTNRESFIAGADLSAKQFTFVIMNTTDRTVVSAGNGVAADGILINKPALGDAATVVTGGRTVIVAGTGGLTAGANVGVDAASAGVVAASGDIIVGKVVDAAAAGGFATVDFFRGGNAEA